MLTEIQTPISHARKNGLDMGNHKSQINEKPKSRFTTKKLVPIRPNEMISQLGISYFVGLQ